MSLNKKGYTLTELVATILILGILGFIAAAEYTRFMERSSAVEAENVIGNLIYSQERYLTRRGHYSERWSGLDSVPPDAYGRPGKEDYTNADNTVYFTKGGGEADPNKGYAVSFNVADHDKAYAVAKRVGASRFSYELVRLFKEKVTYCVPGTTHTDDLELCRDYAGVDSFDEIPPDPRTRL